MCRKRPVASAASFGLCPASLSTTCPSRSTAKYGTLSTPVKPSRLGSSSSHVKGQATDEACLHALCSRRSCFGLSARQTAGVGIIDPSFHILVLLQADHSHQLVPYKTERMKGIRSKWQGKFRICEEIWSSKELAIFKKGPSNLELMS